MSFASSDYPDYTQDPPPAYSPSSPDLPEPSAPLLDLNNRGLEHFSYDQAVNWWNALSETQRQTMQAQGKVLSATQLAELRRDYQQYYPKDYFPRKVYLNDQLSACDYYLMYYLCEEMAARYRWFNRPLIQAFEVPPPPYDDNQQPPSLDEATRWWQSLAPGDRDKLQGRRFAPQQVVLIQREYRPYYRVYYADRVYGSGLDYNDFYLMSRYPSRIYGYPLIYDDFLLFQGMRASLELTSLAVQGGYHLALGVGHAIGSGLQATGHFLGAIGSNALSGSGSSSSISSGSGSGDGKGICAIIIGFCILVGVFFAAAAAVASSIYTGIKASASLANIVQGKKMLRSLWRLTCIGVGAYVGVTQGAVIGAMVGSLVPGVGTAAGAIIGAIFGAPITAALASAFAKYSAQALSWARTGSSNPNKWDVEKANQAMFRKKGRFSMNTAEIQDLYTHLRKQKNQHKTMTGSVAGTSDNLNKNRYNKLLDAVKSGLDPRDGIRVDAHTRFRWNSQKHSLERQNVDLPQLKSGLRL